MIDRGTCKTMLRESARLMLEHAERLSDIDSRFGDGDHGITVTKIAKLVNERIEAWDDASIKDFLDDLGMDVMAVRGGSAGPLYGRSSAAWAPSSATTRTSFPPTPCAACSPAAWPRCRISPRRRWATRP